MIATRHGDRRRRRRESSWVGSVSASAWEIADSRYVQDSALNMAAVGTCRATPRVAAGIGEKTGQVAAMLALHHTPAWRANSVKLDDQAGDVWTSTSTEDIVAARGSQHHGCHGNPAHHYHLLQGPRQ